MSPALLAKTQGMNGAWKAGGQLPRQNRPGSEGDEATTSWAILALASLEQPDPVVNKSMEKAREFLKNSKPAKSQDRLLARLLVEKKFGSSLEAEVALKEVLARQNSDGGWAWINGGKSDPFATGQSLYALTVAGLMTDASVIHRGQRFLLETQTKEGHWVTPPRAVSNVDSEGRNKRLVPIYDFLGHHLGRHRVVAVDQPGPLTACGVARSTSNALRRKRLL